MDEKEVEGAVPTFKQVSDWATSNGFTLEFKLDKTGENPETQSIVGFLIDGINGYLNRTARVKAENTKDSAKEKMIQVFMSKTGKGRADAIARIKEMLSEM